MPGSLGHINSWLLDDQDGVAPVDTGMLLTLCSDEWKALFEGALKDRPINRVICTHLHPDHIGLAGWLCKRFDAELWMTRGEWLTARMLTLTRATDAPRPQRCTGPQGGLTTRLRFMSNGLGALPGAWSIPCLKAIGDSSR